MGSACWAQRIQDPDVVAELAEQPDPDRPSPPDIEGFGWHEATLTKILSRLTQIAHSTARADPSTAPLEPFPAYPHLELREQLRRAPMDNMAARLFPEGGD
ncbi:hypothetical protein [Nocardia xishanensis]